MRARYALIHVVAALLVVAVPSFAALESARELYRQGRFAEAMQLIEADLAAETEDAERSRLLDLLGAVAARQGDYWRALETWQLLIGEYPESPGAEDAAVKVTLVAALLECLGEGETPEEAEEGLAPAAAEETSTPPAVEEAPMPQAVEKPPASEAAGEAPVVEPPPAPEAPAEATEPAGDAGPESAAPVEASPRETPGLVLVAAQGKPYDAVETTSQIVVDYLVSRGVSSESATGGIPVAEESETLLPRLFDAVEDRGAGSLLLVIANFSSFQRVEAELYDPDGNLVWHEKISGGTGWTGRAYTRTGINRELVDRFLEKLGTRVGGPGLPVTGDGD